MKLGKTCLLACLVLWAACDKAADPDHKPAGQYDPNRLHDWQSSTVYYQGAKGFVDTSSKDDDGGIPTVEVCTDYEVSQKVAEMVNQPIIPMVGAGGLDMTGGPDWGGLTADEAQKPEMLCQPSYVGDGIIGWGPQYELLAFFDEETRKIDDMLIRPGYEGALTAGDFVFKVNQPIRKGGNEYTATDGSALDPRTPDVLREIDRALISNYRGISNPEAFDCVDSGSCYVLSSGTLPFLVFMSVGLYVPISPDDENNIVDLEVSLKRPFRIGIGEAEVTGIDNPVIRGTAAAGIGDCEVTYGTDWSHIRQQCLADDPLAMADVRPVYGYEYILANFGGTLLYFKRAGLAVDEILPQDVTLQDGDKVAIVSLNAAYEGDFSMSFSDVLTIFKTNAAAAIRDALDLDVDDKTGMEKLRLPGDPNLPAEVAAVYRDRLRPGGTYAVFCDDDGPDADEEYDSCSQESSGSYLRPLVARVQTELIKAQPLKSFGSKVAERGFFVQQFERAIAEHLNGGPLDDDQLNFSPSASRPDRIYLTATLVSGGETYTFNVFYGGDDDRVHFMNYQKGASRMEEVLFADARLLDPARGAFTFRNLLRSPRFGLGTSGAITVDREVPEQRRALLGISFPGETTQVLAPFTPASGVSGYNVPVKGPQDRFVPADWFSLSGGTIGSGFYMQQTEDGKNKIMCIAAADFFGDVDFCGITVRIGDGVNEVMSQLQARGDCDTMVRRSENNEFVTSITDLDGLLKLNVDNDLVNQVVAWTN